MDKMLVEQIECKVCEETVEVQTGGEQFNNKLCFDCEEKQLYQCVRTLELNKYDDDGFPEEEMMEVSVGTFWYVDEESEKNHVAGSDAFRLVNEEDEWIEIYHDTLEEFFAKIN